MGCAGFTCSKHSLCVLNILYVMVSLLMIGIAAWGKWFGLVSSFQVVGGIIGVGVFLFFVALAGLIGAMKHHQVLLFFVSFRRLALRLRTRRDESKQD
ncbi:Tetraspanin-31 [Nibea albiflora]|uniref:Tetraspanin-31 n=1 Tax=Nibea albiflora TaxID=240163 RepID=A0ACB7ESG1_NIBAL|nr:Tetraspanin-31 [Nibea albiflora]